MAIAKDGVITDSETIRHRATELQDFATIWEQFDYRLNVCRAWTEKRCDNISAVVSRGGLLRPLPGGTYSVSPKMIEDAKHNLQGEHAANLGCALANDLASIYDCPAYVVDPVSVDEFEPLARYSGLPLIERKCLSHALNIHAAGRRAALQLGIPFDESRFVVAHLGGGISVAPLRGGKIIDVNDASSDGPFSAERSGGLPLQQFISLCFSGRHTQKEVRQFVRSQGGLLAYLGTNDVAEVEKRIEKDDAEAKQVLEAMAYQIAKEIGAMSTVLKGKIDAIVLTGGGAHSRMLTSLIKHRVNFVAQVIIFEGEDEMSALAMGALRVLTGEEQAQEY